MPLSIKSREADQLARELASVTGQTITVAVTAALKEKLQREKLTRANREALLAEIRAIADHYSSLPVLDTRTDDEILGYDENGIPS